MRAELLKLSHEPVRSFNVRQDHQPNNSCWHYHPEIELIYFHKGEGTQFVGDSVKRFGQGDLVLIGKNLPHFWKFDAETVSPHKNNLPYSTVIHFREEFWSGQFLNLPENYFIKSTLGKAKRGIQLSFECNTQPVLNLMNDLLHVEGTKRIIILLEILLIISKSSEMEFLASAGFQSDFEESDSFRLNLIYDYSFKNFKNKIALKEIADVSNMAPNSFCRYFKAKTNKTYTSFITDIRIGYACKLLIENQMNIKQVCFESGFQNFSSFHASFKQTTGKSPLTYQHQYLDLAM